MGNETISSFAKQVVNPSVAAKRPTTCFPLKKQEIFRVVYDILLSSSRFGSSFLYTLPSFKA
jgi:hypothetical protein